MVAGFAALTPAGLGVRDAILMEFLAPVFTADQAATALVSAVLVRVVWLVAELAFSGILYFVPTGMGEEEGGDAERGEERSRRELDSEKME
jgi:uncharacterized membrane protein YbhN (UPF0104 family)